MAPPAIKALTFDVFGTVVDWRTSIINEGRRLDREKGLNVDWAAFADAWRALYQPSISRVRTRERAWAILDRLHRENLDRLVPEFDLQGLDEGELDDLNRVWHRLLPWPDAVPGLTRLKHAYILATLSNGNVALLVNMAKHAGLPWDVILGAEVTRHYKPLPQAYTDSAQLLGLPPEQCMMVAAHNDDLKAAAACGLHTALVIRPTEYGPNQRTDLEANGNWDFVAGDLVDLAVQLGC